MPSTSLIAPILMISGLVGVGAHASPVPDLEVADAQLRATNHRGISSASGATPLEALTGQDFVLLERDGSWVDRAAFLARTRQPVPRSGPSHQHTSVRLYGPVAVVHGVFETPHADGTMATIRYTDVHVWNGAVWQLVSVQNTAVRNAAELRLIEGVAPAHVPWRGQDPAGDDLAVLRTLNENYVRAFRDADVAWYDAHLAPDYVVVSGDGSFRNREAALAEFAKPSFAAHMRSFPVDKVNIRRFGDVALIHAENDYELKDGRKGVNRYTDIWHRQDGRWRCIAAHITVHRAPGT